MYNNSISSCNNQEKNKISLIVAKQQVIDLLVSHGHDAVFVKVLNYLLLCFKRNKGQVFPSQETIARYAQCSREHVNRIIKLLSDKKLIYKRRFPYSSCSYWLHAVFFDYHFRWEFKDIFSALKWTTLYEKLIRRTKSLIDKARHTVVKASKTSQYYITKGYINIKNTCRSSDTNVKEITARQLYPIYVDKPRIQEDPDIKISKIQDAFKESPNNIFLRIICQGLNHEF